MASAKAMRPSVIELDVISFPRRWFAAFWRLMNIRDYSRQLHAVPDEILKDIGISRGEIESIATSIIDGDPTRMSRGRRVA